MSDVSALPDHSAHALARLIQFYETLTPQSLQQLERCYAADAYFKDPFNEVRGLPAITAIFEHMFAALHEPRFVITQTLVQDRRAALEWEFRFCFRRWRPDVQQCIRGASLLTLDAQGRVSQHRDYWDAAEDLYEKLPGIGMLMRWLRQNAAVKTKAAGPHSAGQSPS